MGMCANRDTMHNYRKATGKDKGVSQLIGQMLLLEVVELKSVEKKTLAFYVWG
jgi:hypothetical protein